MVRGACGRGGAAVGRGVALAVGRGLATVGRVLAGWLGLSKVEGKLGLNQR